MKRSSSSSLTSHKLAKRSEQISPAQGSLLDELLNTYLEAELKALHPVTAQAEPRQQPKHAPLQPQFPRTVIHHEPNNTHYACGCHLQRVGEDVSEKLDYTPGVFMHATNSSTCVWRIKASWQSIRFTRLADYTKSSDTPRT